MARVRYLADTSVLTRLSKPGVARAFTPLAAAGSVALCAPVVFELGVTARSRATYRQLVDGLTAYDQVPVNDADHRRALEVQAMLADKSQHRRLSLVDALLAAVAEARKLTVLHYDADFEAVADLTGQAHQWIVGRGTAD
ncbi:MAG: PIN domain nuclease [Acidimicrobiia bacterium]